MIKLSDISKILKESDLTIKRPGTGIYPEFRELVIGMKACKELDSDTVIHWNDLKDA